MIDYISLALLYILETTSQAPICISQSRHVFHPAPNLPEPGNQQFVLCASYYLKITFNYAIFSPVGLVVNMDKA